MKVYRLVCRQIGLDTWHPWLQTPITKNLAMAERTLLHLMDHESVKRDGPVFEYRIEEAPSEPEWTPIA